jgi:hypothetical protein
MTFEEQVTKEIRRLGRWLVVIALILFVTIMTVAYGLSKALNTASQLASETVELKFQAAELKQVINSPVHGRDILIWCGAINRLEMTLLQRHQVAKQRHLPGTDIPLKLPLLDCAQLARSAPHTR